MASLSFCSILVIFFIGFTSANNMTRSYKGYWCDYKDECQQIIGSHSLCIANECQCIPHYHINYNSICVRDRGLWEPCFSDDDCYWGPEMVDKIECDLGVCDCIYGYVPGPGKICVKYFAHGTGNKQTFQFLLYILAIMLLIFNKY